METKQSEIHFDEAYLRSLRREAFSKNQLINGEKLLEIIDRYPSPRKEYELVKWIRSQLCYSKHEAHYSKH
ncbi:MAG: hypothetical protein KDD53_11410 [Bdellovibrionales bacterium]|nr:hypothetical protein [Bdellovibrionales bacterium]